MKSCSRGQSPDRHHGSQADIGELAQQQEDEQMDFKPQEELAVLCNYFITEKTNHLRGKSLQFA